MSDEPAAKRMKNSDEFANLRAEVAGPVKEKLMELDAVQHQLDVMSEKAAEEILKVEQTFNKKRMPIYEKRKKLTTQIDSFWQTAFLNHHLLSTAIPEEQEDLLAALRDLEVQEFDDLRSGFKIIMKFDKNPYFDNEVIVKSYHLQSESPSTEITEIQWKENRKPAEKTEDGDNSAITFLEWLTYAAPPDSDEIAEVIKDDLYINPLQYYVMPDMQEVEEDDIEDFLCGERGVDENGHPLRIHDTTVDSSITMQDDEDMEPGAEPEAVKNPKSESGKAAEKGTEEEEEADNSELVDEEEEGEEREEYDEAEGEDDDVDEEDDEEEQGANGDVADDDVKQEAKDEIKEETD